MDEGGPETCATQAQSEPHWSQSTIQLYPSHPEPSNGRYKIIVLKVIPAGCV